MEEKSDLMLEAQGVQSKINALQREIDEMQNSLNTVDARMEAEKDAYRKDGEEKFEQKKQKKLEEIEEKIQGKLQEISDLCDTFPDLDKREIAGRFEIRELEDHLLEIYPPDLIVGYKCLNLINIADDNEAYKMYTSIENMVIGLRNGSVAGIVFSTMSDLLDKAADKTGSGWKVAIAVAILMVVILILSPFTFIFLLSLAGVCSAAHGLFVQSLLRKLYSVKSYLNNAYDEDLFAQDKSDIMSSSNKFFDSVKEPYVEAIVNSRFKVDSAYISSIEQRYMLEKQRLDSNIDLKNQELDNFKSNLNAILEKIEKLDAEEKDKAAKARTKYLGGIDWKEEWLENIFLGISEQNRVRALPMKKGNTIFYSANLAPLQTLSRLIVLQSILHMKPTFATTYVFDYKYNGGELTQFLTLPPAVITMCYDNEAISKRSEIMTNTIRARAKTILSSCSDLDEFNNLMKSYGTQGESYVITHIFGLSQLSNELISNMKNGPKVGYFFKLYLTKQELQELGDSLCIGDFAEFYEVNEDPMPRSSTLVQRLLKDAS